MARDTWTLGQETAEWRDSTTGIQREAEAALTIVSAVAAAALAFGVTHYLSRLRERRRGHAISNRILAQVFPRGLR